MSYPTQDVNDKLRQWLQEAPQRERSNRLLQYLILGVAVLTLVITILKH